AAIFASSLSTQTTFIPKSARHAPVTSPTYPVPTMQTFMRLRSSSGRLAPMPFDRAAHPLRQRHACPEAEQPLRLLGRGVRHRDVAGLVGHPFDCGLLAGRGLDLFDEARERDRVRASQVHDLETGGGVERR